MAPSVLLQTCLWSKVIDCAFLEPETLWCLSCLAGKQERPAQFPAGPSPFLSMIPSYHGFIQNVIRGFGHFTCHTAVASGVPMHDPSSYRQMFSRCGSVRRFRICSQSVDFLRSRVPMISFHMNKRRSIDTNERLIKQAGSVCSCRWAEGLPEPIFLHGSNRIPLYLLRHQRDYGTPLSLLPIPPNKRKTISAQLSMNQKSIPIAILPGTGMLLPIIHFLALHSSHGRGESPGRSTLGIQFLTGFLAKLVLGDEFGHGITSFQEGMRSSCCGEK